MNKKIQFYRSHAELKNTSRAMVGKIAKYAAKNIRKSDKVLDVLTGYANFLIQLVKIKKVKVIGIDNSGFIIKAAKKNTREAGLANLITLRKIDARNMPFPNNYFDSVVNYAGWGDVALTCGKIGIKKIIKEMARVLRPNGKIIISFPLAEKPKNKTETIDEKIQVYLYGRKRHYPKEVFIKELRKNMIKIINRRIFSFPNKRICPGVAKEFLRSHQKEVCAEFGVKSKSCGQIWGKFGSFIEEYGFSGGRSMIILVGRK